MSAFSDSVTTIATNLLREFGESASFTRVEEGAYDASDGSVAAGSTTNYTGFVVPIDYIGKEIDGIYVLQGDIKLFVEKTSTEPLRGDVVTLNSLAYRVMETKKFRVNGENLLYELQVRV